MVISAERAFWILDFYQRHKTRLVFGGRILGEEATCIATISDVSIDMHSIEIKLISDHGEQTLDRRISLEMAGFFFDQILVISFPDGTTMFLAEQTTTG
jgi:hypothetical protein